MSAVVGAIWENLGSQWAAETQPRGRVVECSGAVYSRQRRRFAHPHEIRIKPTAALHEAVRAAAERAGLSVEAWMVEAAELALTLGKTR